jgi:transcriptional regulator with XRE-family HTH domain
MATNRIHDLLGDNALGAYLRSRRTAMDASSLGYSGRRRTSGLRREEVALRASISATWYTWLEQGRGGKPSSEVLDRLARALVLTEAEREHLFMLGLGHRAEPRYRGGAAIPATLQKLLNTLEFSPALVRTATWDVIAWNRAALKVLTDYEALPMEQRNILRLIFFSPEVRRGLEDWQSVARYVVAAFRADTALAGAEAEVAPLVADLLATSPEFAAIWREAQVQTHGEELKRVRHPLVGDIELEYNSFGLHGRPDLTLIVYNPASDRDFDRVRTLVRAASTEKDLYAMPNSVFASVGGMATSPPESQSQ